MLKMHSCPLVGLRCALLLLAWVAAYNYTKAQSIAPAHLTARQVDSVLHLPDIAAMHIKWPVFRAYAFNDEAGDHLLILTEKPLLNSPNNHNDSIQAFCLKHLPTGHIVEWQLLDYLAPTQNVHDTEFSTWFWTKYLRLADWDGDGLVEPLIVYGTAGINGMADGRLKLMLYYKGKKYAIRHQNSPLDGLRSTRVDKDFYALPTSIRAQVTEIMELITANGHGIFPHGWQEQMQAGETQFDER